MPWPCVVTTPRRLRRQHKTAHGFGGYAWTVLDLLHFVARRRLTALKRTAAMPGCGGHKEARQFAALNCTQPVRGKSRAIEHNRALPKVGQSLRWASLGGLPLRALRVRVMVGYVLRPSPDKGYLGLQLFSQAAQWWRGPLPRLRARALAGVAGGQLVAKVGAACWAHNCKLHWAE